MQQASCAAPHVWVFPPGSTPANVCDPSPGSKLKSLGTGSRVRLLPQDSSGGAAQVIGLKQREAPTGGIPQSVALSCSQKESRPVGALRLTIPCYPGLNALDYRISPLSGLPGDCVARQ